MRERVSMAGEWLTTVLLRHRQEGGYRGYAAQRRHVSAVHVEPDRQHVLSPPGPVTSVCLSP